MAKKRLYLDEADTDASCESGGSVGSYDLISTDSAADSTANNGTFSHTSWARHMEWDVQVNDLLDGTCNLSISINAISKADVRMGVEVLDGSCTAQDSDTDTTTYTTTGIKTFTSKSLTVSGSNRVRLFIDTQRSAGEHGNADITLDTDHASSYIEYEYDAAATPRRVFVVS